MSEPYGADIARLYLMSWPCVPAGFAWEIAMPGNWPLLLIIPGAVGLLSCTHRTSRDEPNVTGWRRLTTQSPFHQWWCRFLFGVELKRALRLARDPNAVERGGNV